MFSCSLSQHARSILDFATVMYIFCKQTKLILRIGFPESKNQCQIVETAEP